MRWNFKSPLERWGKTPTSAAVETRPDMATTENTPDLQAPVDPTPGGNGTAAPAPATTTEPDPHQKLSELETKHAEVADAYLRAKAESENTRRRAEEEISKARRFAVESFAESMLPVKDSLEAAISIQNATPEQLLEGVHATLRQLSGA